MDSAYSQDSEPRLTKIEEVSSFYEEEKLTQLAITTTQSQEAFEDYSQTAVARVNSHSVAKKIYEKLSKEESSCAANFESDIDTQVEGLSFLTERGLLANLGKS